MIKLNKLETKILGMLEDDQYKDCLGDVNNIKLAQDLAKLIGKK